MDMGAASRWEADACKMDDRRYFLVPKGNYRFRGNYFGKEHDRPAEELLIDRAQLLTLTLVLPRCRVASLHICRLLDLFVSR